MTGQCKFPFSLLEVIILTDYNTNHDEWHIDYWKRNWNFFPLKNKPYFNMIT